jgi:hypothetical protein
MSKRNKCITILAIYIVTSIIVTISLRWYRWHASPWRKVPTNVWEQIAAQMRAGRQLAPLDSVMILADVDAWLRGTNE